MAGFIRRFDFMPSTEVLSEIEGIAIIEQYPPSVFLGRATGAVCLVGEWPGGPFNTPTLVDGGQATINGVFGGFHLSCVDPLSYDSGFVNPYSNGNAYAWIARKRFRRLVLVRPDLTLAEGVHLKLTSSPAVAATGSIQLPAGGGADINNGEAFVLADGYNHPVGFEYRSSGSARPGYVQIDFTAGDSQATIAGATRTAVVAQKTAGKLAMTAGVVGSGAFSLTNDYAGEHGNVPIETTVAAAGFATGMSGGTGMGVLLAPLTLPAGTRVRDASSTAREYAIAQSVTWDRGTDLGTAANTSFDPADLAKLYSTRTVADVPVYSTTGTAEGAVGNVDSVDATDLFRADVGAGTSRPAIVATASTGATDGAGANDAALTPLTSDEVDAAYETALDSTKPGNPIVDNVDVIACARESEVIRGALRDNARDASAQGTGRRAVIRPPIGTKLAGMRLDVSPGVGITRSKRVIYCVPHYEMRLPEIARLDPTAAISTPSILVGADSMMAQVLSQLPPEANPGQSTSEIAEGGLLSPISRLEPGLTTVSDSEPTVLELDDYVSMKAYGIACLRRDPQLSEWVFQSGVTSVDPSVYPSYAPVNQVRMADFVNDSLAMIGKKYGKKVKTPGRFHALVGEFVDFLELLKSEDDPDSKRIEDYSIKTREGNTAALAGTGISKIEVKVQQLETLDVIALVSTIGTGVQIETEDVGA